MLFHVYNLWSISWCNTVVNVQSIDEISVCYFFLCSLYVHFYFVPIFKTHSYTMEKFLCFSTNTPVCYCIVHIRQIIFIKYFSIVPGFSNLVVLRSTTCTGPQWLFPK